MKSDRRSHPQATRRQRGRAVTQGVTGRRPRASKARTGATHVAPVTAWLRERGEVLPFSSTRLADRIRFPCAEACGPRLYIRGSIHDHTGFRRLSAARYPGHTAGPVLQHRPSETLPRLWSEREGLAM